MIGAVDAKTSHRHKRERATMNSVDLDLVVNRAASRALRQRQYDTFALMEPSVHMPLEAFRQIAELEQSDYTSVRTVLGAFVEMASPRTYLEIGTRRGHSLCMVANCAPGPVDIYSFDLWIHDYAGESNPGLELIKRELKKFDFRGEARFFSGDSRQTIRAFFQQPAHPQHIDLIFVDGDHSDEGARTDLLNVVDHVSVGGLLVFDDITHPLYSSLRGVWHDLMDRRVNFELRECTKHEYGWAIARRHS
jgi:predicted O-methyltransferase YrrM